MYLKWSRNCTYQFSCVPDWSALNHCGRVVIYVSVNKVLVTSGMDLLLVRHQYIIWTNAGLSLIWLLRQIGSKIESKYDNHFTKKSISEMSSRNWRLSSLSCNVLMMIKEPYGIACSVIVCHYCVWCTWLKKFLTYSIHYHICDKCCGTFVGCACAGNAGNPFPATNFKGNR